VVEETAALRGFEETSVKHIVVMVTVWVMGLVWVLTSVASPAVSASAVAPAAAPVVHHKTARLCSTVNKAGQAACYAIRQTDTVQPPGVSVNAVSPNATPAGYGPSTLVAAYKLDQSKGGGQTVAVVDAYDDPNAESDLAAYRTQYGLPSCTTANGCFKKVNQSGSTTNLPSPNASWAGEISLDLDMVSATCPNCHILLVEATSPTYTNLGTAVNRAVTLGAKYVSNSYGGSESSSESSYDSTYYHHAGVTITASTGDSNYLAEYPATGAYVTAVGGTSLTSANNARGWTETVWNNSSTQGTGSGCSVYIAKPSFQTSVTTGCGNRAEADVSAVADPNTGVAVFDTYQAAGWQVYGGTSASSPIIASVYALAGVPGASDSPNAYPYSHTSSLYDVTSGNNGTCSPTVLCTAGTGWDGPTGLGTPHGSAAFTRANIISVTNPGTQTSTAGSPLSLQLQASDTGSGSTLSYSATGLPPGLVINSGTGLISGTPNTAGNYTVTATATDGTSASGSTIFTWVIQALVTAPGAPTGVSAVAGNASVVVSWTAPVSNGGSPITAYTIAPSPACPACTGMTTTALSSTVSGLTNGTPYTFTVTATNAAGTSPPSAASAAVTPAAPASGVIVGNPLVARTYASDTSVPAGTQAPLLAVLPNAKLPAGVLQSFRYWNQGGVAVGQVFHGYVLRPDPVVANKYTVIYDSGLQTVPALTVPTGEVETVPVPVSVSVAAGDVIGFYGEGIPLTLSGADTTSYVAPVAPALGGTMTLGVDAGFPIYPQARTYSFAATVAS
jgi:subtilase family serine protease